MSYSSLLRWERSDLMSSQNPSDNLSPDALTFLQEHPTLSDSLLADCNYDLQKITTLLEPIFSAQSRCQIAPFYIQVVHTGQTTFLTTNLLPGQQEVRVSAVSSSWLIGRSSACAIAILDPTISRCHAVIGHRGGSDFYIMDMGSSNGTCLNRHRLPQLERHKLRDGDLIEFGFVRVEFFANSVIAQNQVRSTHLAPENIDITYH